MQDGESYEKPSSDYAPQWLDQDKKETELNLQLFLTRV